MKRIQISLTSPLALLFCCLACVSCESPQRPGPTPDPAKDDLSLYRKTNGQAGHEFVKTEEFLVPVGSVVVIQGLEFAPGVATLTRSQQRIVQQVFNSLEEITENTVGDTNHARVAEFKQMTFEVRGYPDDSGSPEAKAALALARAQAVMTYLTSSGTPPWRLKATGAAGESSITAQSAGGRSKQGRVVFIRTR